MFRFKNPPSQLNSAGTSGDVGTSEDVGTSGDVGTVGRAVAGCLSEVVLAGQPLSSKASSGAVIRKNLWGSFVVCGFRIIGSPS